jgi:hypothetical protein
MTKSGFAVQGPLSQIEAGYVVEFEVEAPADIDTPA